MYLRLGLLCLIPFIFLSCTTSAKSNGPRPAFPRRHHRRAAGLSEFLTPPPPPSFRNPPPFSNGPFRHGKLLNPSVPPSSEAPGYFSRLMRWLNPFGRDLSVPPAPATPKSNNNNNNIQAEFLQPPPPPPSQNTYRPPLAVPQIHATQYQPHDHLLPQPPSPPVGQSYSPPLNGNNCNPCNVAPWIPINNGIGGHSDGLDVQGNYHAAPIAHEVRPPDFGYGLPEHLDHQVLVPQQNINIPPAQFDSPFTGPIPNPHIYPGAIPPLYKATEFHSAESEQQALHSETSSQLVQTPTQQGNAFSNSASNPITKNFFPAPTASAHSSESYVDILPVGGDVAFVSDQFSTNTGEVQDTGSSGSDSHQILYSGIEHSAASLNPVTNTLLANSPSFSINNDNNNNNRQLNGNSNAYGTKVLTNGDHIIHVEQSPVIDLSGSEYNDTSSSSSISSDSIAEAPVIFQNSDGTYGINASWPNGDSSRVVWPTDKDDELSTSVHNIAQQIQDEEAKLKPVDTKVYKDNSDPIITQETSDPRNISILIQVFQNSNNSTNDRKELELRNSSVSSNTTNKFMNDLMKSYNNFEKEVTELKKSRHWFNSKNIDPVSEMGMSPRKENLEQVSIQGQNRNSKATNPQQGSKKSKQYQVIIPYTSQYTPEPFHPAQERNKEESSKSQGRKVLASNHNQNIQEINEKVHEISDNDELDLSHIIEALDNLPKEDILKISPSTKTNTSIDGFRLQKNIDNWTIQEYSSGTTASLATPSAHPHLTPSKKIPDEYFTTTEPVSVINIKEAKHDYRDLLAGFNFNDLDHDASASSQIDVPHTRVTLSQKNPSITSSELDSISSSDVNGASSEDVSWEQLPVSISPLSNERVYVVTPQSPLKPTSFNSNSTNERTKVEIESSNGSSTTQFESIERAYQVLPQAVNNLAVASTGPATIPLWGIMEHEEYASSFNTSTKKPEVPILYSGHSKVSHTRQ